MAQPVKSMNNLPRELLRSEIARYLDPKSLVCLKVASVQLCMLANDATLESCAHLTGLPVGLAIKRVIDWVKCEDLGPIYEDEYNDVLVESSYHGPPAAPLNLSRRSIFALNSPNKSILTRSAIEYYAWLLQRLQMARMPFSTSDYGDLRIRPMLFSGPRYIDYGGDKGAKPIPGCNPHGRINVGADPNCLAAGPLLPTGRDAWQMKFPPMRAPGTYVLAFYGGANPFHAKVHVQLRLVGEGSRSNSNSSSSSSSDLTAFTLSSKTGVNSIATDKACGASASDTDVRASDILIDVGKMDWFRETNLYPSSCVFEVYLPVCRPIIIEGVTCGRHPSALGDWICLTEVVLMERSLWKRGLVIPLHARDTRNYSDCAAAQQACVNEMADMVDRDAVQRLAKFGARHAVLRRLISRWRLRRHRAVYHCEDEQEL